MKKGWKTVIFNCLFAILPVLEVAGADLGLSGQSLAWYGIGMVVANLILRKLTTTPMGESE